MKKRNFLFRTMLMVSLVMISLSGCKDNDDYHVCPPIPEPEKQVTPGIYFLMGGNVNNGQNGELFYMGQYAAALPRFNQSSDVYQLANPGHKAGALLEDMFIYDGKIFLLTQHGTKNGGDGQLVVLNAQTLKTENVFTSLGFAEDIYPQHIAVIGNKAYIQYAEGLMESNSGLRVFDMSTGKLENKDIAKTYGEFGKAGATKGRMLLYKGILYVPCGEKLLIINTADDTLVKEYNTGRQIKGIVKGFDQHIYMALAGTFTLPNGAWAEPEYTSESSVVKMSAVGEVVSETKLPVGLDFPVNSGVPNVGMCASFTENTIFFGGKYDYDYWRVKEVYKFDCTNGAITKIDLVATTANQNGLMGYMCVDPWTNRLVVPFQGNQFAVYNAANCELVEYNKDNRAPVPFCAGIDCTERFKDVAPSK